MRQVVTLYGRRAAATEVRPRLAAAVAKVVGIGVGHKRGVGDARGVVVKKSASRLAVFDCSRGIVHGGRKIGPSRNSRVEERRSGQRRTRRERCCRSRLRLCNCLSRLRLGRLRFGGSCGFRVGRFFVHLDTPAARGERGVVLVSVPWTLVQRHVNGNAHRKSARQSHDKMHTMHKRVKKKLSNDTHLHL